MKRESKEKTEQILDALESPSSYTQEEMKDLLSDEENLKTVRSVLRAREALARENIPSPDVDMEWKKFSKRHKRKSTTLMIAASIAVAACIALFFLPDTRNDSIIEGVKVFEASGKIQTFSQDTIDGVAIIRVPRGMQKKVTLPDGTSVTLNAESMLSFEVSHYGKNERKVTLKGEGLFDVAKDTIHPFIVTSGKLDTHVLGTVFNMRNYETEEEKITLISGSLKVVSMIDSKSLTIKPGEQAILGDNSLRAETTLHTGNIASWHEGFFYFDNQTMAEILCELGRWYNVSVVFMNKASMDGRLHFKARRDEKLDSVLELLNYISKDAVKFDGKTIIVGK